MQNTIDPTHRYLSSPERIERIEHHFGTPAVLRRFIRDIAKSGKLPRRPERALQWVAQVELHHYRTARKALQARDFDAAKRAMATAKAAGDCATRIALAQPNLRGVPA